MVETILSEPRVLRVAGRDGAVVAAARDASAAPVVAVGSTGAGALEPLLVVTEDDRTTFYANATPERATAVASALGDPDALPVPDATAGPSEGGGLPSPDLDGFSTSRSVLARCGWVRPASPDDYDAAAGFTDRSSADVRDAASDVCGRGWGDWSADDSVGPLWTGVRDRDGAPVVIVNAHGNPGDVLLAESDPFAVLEGAAHVARVIDADRVVAYIASDDEVAGATLRAAAAAYPSFPASVDVVEGPPAYRAAEPTMAVEAVEGTHRLEARLRPPGPDVAGVNGGPTVVHTARTLAHVAAAVRGDPVAGRIVTVTGDAPASTLELGADDTVADAVDRAGVTAFRAALVGGRFGGLTADLDVAPTPPALTERGLGTDGVVEVLGPDRCPVAFVGRRTRFAAEENCGRCVPCREGATQLTALLRDVYGGDLDEPAVEELLRVMASTSVCAFGRHAVRPVRTALREFREEFEAHASGACPAGECDLGAAVDGDALADGGTAADSIDPEGRP